MARVKNHTKVKEPIRLRMKSLSNGSKSLYLDIYRDGTRLVMIMEAPDDFDFDAAMARMATLPRQQEWEEYVGRAQQCDPSATSAGKWRMMSQIFEL